MQFIIIFLTLLNLTVIDIESKEIFINENDFQIVFTSKIIWNNINHLISELWVLLYFIWFFQDVNNLSF
jgi:hypothetical protein